MTAKPLNGRHVFASFVCGFGIIIAVNMTLAVNAVRTFPGLETANSYVASQSFDARRVAQQSLGWQVRLTYDTGSLHLFVDTADGAILDPSRFTAVVGRPTTRALDGEVVFDAAGDAQIDLAPGRWRVDLKTVADHGPFSQSFLIEVAE